MYSALYEIIKQTPFLILQYYLLLITIQAFFILVVNTFFQTKDPTVIDYDNHEYIFEGFSVMSHYKLENVPTCKVMRFNIEYTIHWYEEVLPEVSPNFHLFIKSQPTM